MKPKNTNYNDTQKDKTQVAGSGQQIVDTKHQIKKASTIAKTNLKTYFYFPPPFMQPFSRNPDKMHACSKNVEPRKKRLN